MNTMKIEEVESRVKHALYSLSVHDSELFDVNVNERTITAMLARYLATEFPGFDVDCEYNRNGENSKKIYWISDELKRRFVDRVKTIVNKNNTESTQDELISNLNKARVFPDIIIHKRGLGCKNLLIIEAKKENADHVDVEWDKFKLQKYTSKKKKDDQMGDKREDKLEYNYGLLLTLPSKIDVQKNITGLCLTGIRKVMQRK